jgi:hypothetical protein
MNDRPKTAILDPSFSQPMQTRSGMARTYSWLLEIIAAIGSEEIQVSSRTEKL